MPEGGRFLYFLPIFSWFSTSLSDIAWGVGNASRGICLVCNYATVCDGRIPDRGCWRLIDANKHGCCLVVRGFERCVRLLLVVCSVLNPGRRRLRSRRRP